MGNITRNYVGNYNYLDVSLRVIFYNPTPILNISWPLHCIKNTAFPRKMITYEKCISKKYLIEILMKILTLTAFLKRSASKRFNGSDIQSFWFRINKANARIPIRFAARTMSVRVARSKKHLVIHFQRHGIIIYGLSYMLQKNRLFTTWAYIFNWHKHVNTYKKVCKHLMLKFCETGLFSTLERFVFQFGKHYYHHHNPFLWFISMEARLGDCSYHLRYLKPSQNWLYGNINLTRLKSQFNYFKL